MGPRPEPCVGAIVFDEERRLLLVERGRGPAIGQWSVPGGRVEPGETLEQAVEREVFEETGLTVRCGEFVGWVQRISDEYHFVIMDFMADVVGDGHGVAADDAAALAWVPIDQLGNYRLVDGLMEFLTDHDVI